MAMKEITGAVVAIIIVAGLVAVAVKGGGTAPAVIGAAGNSFASVIKAATLQS